MATFNVMFQVVLQLALSVTTTLNWKMPLVGGVPLSRPSEVRLSQLGSALPEYL